MVAFSLSFVVILSYVYADPDTFPPKVGDTTVTISIDQDIQEVNVQPGETGVTSFTGTVTVDVMWQSEIQYLVVSLNYVASPGSAVGTSQLIFEKGVYQLPFESEVKIPQMSMAGEGHMSVSGQWRYSPGSIKGPAIPDEAIVLIKPYSKPTIGADKGYKVANVGEECTFEMRLINEGNSGDNITLIYDVPDGVEVSAPLTMQVDAKSENNFLVKVVQNSGAPRTNVMTIHAVGYYEGKEAEMEYEIQLKTRISPSSFAGPLFIFPILIIGFIVLGAYILFRIRRKKKAPIR